MITLNNSQRKAIKRKRYFLKVFLFFAIPFVFIFCPLFLYFKITAPEASTILQHYILGDGEKLELHSTYLPTSPVIVKKLNKMRVGQTKVVRFEQYKDWRLSYALNPFALTKNKNGFEIHQFIKFDTSGSQYTYIQLLGKRIKIYDNWVNVLHPTPFHVHYKHIE
jgi:hypothetical protein